MNKQSSHKLKLLLLFISGALLSQVATAQILWSDEFDSGTAPNSAVWSYDLGGGGWCNGELQEYTSDPANVRIENGTLIITAQEIILGKTRTAYTSARIKTENKLSFTYGTLEARIMVPDLNAGLWPAFWTLGSNFSTAGWPNCGELDIMEMGFASAIADGTVNRYVVAGSHWKLFNQYENAFGSYLSPSDLNGSFHIYRMEWTPSLISTYIDNQLIFSLDISDPANDAEEFHLPQFLLLNMAVGGGVTGIFTPSEITASFPAQYVIDYVRIYDNGYTVLGGSSIDGGDPVVAHVDSIVPGSSGTRNKIAATATVVIVDAAGAAVADATVTGTFGGSHNQTVNGTTDANGSVTLVTSVTSSTVAFDFCVDDVSGASLTYDAVANVETCDTY